MFAAQRYRGGGLLTGSQSRQSFRIVWASGANTEKGAMPKLLVCVEGAIGAGKSTLLNNLDSKTLPGVKTLKEPVDEWKGVTVGDGKNMLEGMYDGSLPSSLFQLSVLQSRFAPLVAALCDPQNKIVVSERGPWSEKEVFARSNLSKGEFACYEFAHASLTKNLIPLCGDIDVLFLHLFMPTDSVMERIVKRGRAEEASITNAYISTLQEAHTKMKRELVAPGDLGDAPNILSVKHIEIYADQDEEELARVALDTILRAAE